MKKEKAPKGTVKKVLHFLRGYRISIVLSLLMILTDTVFTLLIPLFFGKAIDCIAGTGRVDFEGIKNGLSRAVLLILICGVCKWTAAALNNRITFGVAKDIRLRAFEKINILPVSYLDSHRAGETLSKITADVSQFSDGLLLGFNRFFSGVISVSGTLVLLLRLNIPVALTVAVLTPLSLFAARFISSRSYGCFREQTRIRGKQTALVNETLGEIKTVKAFSREDAFCGEFDGINEKLKTASLKAIFYSSLTNPVTRFVNSLVYAAAALAGAVSILTDGGLTVGILAAVLSYANQYTKPFNEISSVFAELQNALACASGVIDLIEQEGEKESNELSLPENTEGNININNVCFSYDGEKDILKDICINAKAGTVTAIVGATGCGKTTLINLLMRFYDADSGTVTLDSRDITKFPRSELRSRCAMVLQDTWIKSGTVRENILVGKPDATDEEVIGAAKRAYAHSFISRLPEGYDTLLRENGTGLSQGEKQLICIARVMLSPAPVLILDEATSSIDLRTEVRVQKAFAELMKNSTAFVVAHRLSTVMNADNIVCMKDGRIAEQGTHRELLERGGLYSELWNNGFSPG